MNNYNQLSEKEKDVFRIQKILSKNNIILSFKEVEDLWCDYSETTWYASWESLPSDNELIFKRLNEFIEIRKNG